MRWLLYAYAMACGTLNPVHSGFNATLSHHLGAVRAACVSAALSALTIAALALVRGEWTLPAGVSDVPWWAWGSGFIEAFIVLSQPVVAPKIGAASYTGLLVTSSIVMSVVLDQIGGLGFAQRTATAGRIVGAALMVAGVTMVAAL